MVEQSATDPSTHKGLINKRNLQTFLNLHTRNFHGEFTIERIGDGQSCLTYLIKGDSWETILRRPPRGDIPAGAFDVLREFRVMQALSDAGSPVPVSSPIIACPDSAVIGAPFYLMEKLNGLTLRETFPSYFNEDDQTRISEYVVRTLHTLHSLDYHSIGLSTFGKAEDFLERQLRRMHHLWSSARTREIPIIETVGTWLQQNVPRHKMTSLIHGDYKLDNLMFADASPTRLIAVMDWEMSTLGDPLVDLGWLLYFWRDPGEEPLGLTISSVTQLSHFFRRKELLSRYLALTGFSDRDIHWYIAFAGWKIAIIMEGSYRRYRDGIHDHPLFTELERAVFRFADRANAALKGELI